MLFDLRESMFSRQMKPAEGGHDKRERRVDHLPALDAYLDNPGCEKTLRAAAVAVIEALALAGVELAGIIAAGCLQ
jgi:hypothetical protein